LIEPSSGLPGANVNEEVGDRTPLELAMSFQQDEMVHLLLRYGAEYGPKMVHMMLKELATANDPKRAKFLRSSVLEILQHSHGDLSATLDDQTVLEIAIETGDIEIVELLVASNAVATDALTSHGVTPSELVVSHLVAAHKAGTSVTFATRTLELLAEQHEPVILAVIATCNEADLAHRTLRRLLQVGSDPMSADQAGSTALHKATAKGSTAVLRLLLESGAAVNVTDNDGRTPLSVAVQQGSETNTQILLQNGADVTQSHNPLDNKATLLHEAVWSGNPEVLRLICESSAEIDAVSSFNRSALHMASYLDVTGNQQQTWDTCATVLLDNGADPNKYDAHGQTPLMLVIKHGGSNLQPSGIVKILLDHGADPMAADYNMDSPLGLAMKNNNVPLFKALRSHVMQGENIAQPRMLAAAVQSGSQEMVNEISSGDASQNYQILYWAAYYSQLALARFILDRVSKDQLQEAARASSTRRSLLHWLAIWNSAIPAAVDIMNMLIKANLRPDIRDCTGKTALELAAQNGNSLFVDCMSKASDIDPAILSNAEELVMVAQSLPEAGATKTEIDVWKGAQANPDARYMDRSFPPSVTSLSPQHAATYSTAEWIRVQDIGPGTPKLFGDSAVGRTPPVGPNCGNPWLWAAIALGGREGITSMFPEGPSLSPSGIYSVHIQTPSHGSQTVMIDDLIPCVRTQQGTIEPICGGLEDSDEVWWMLVVKAFAKALGSYDELLKPLDATHPAAVDAVQGEKLMLDGVRTAMGAASMLQCCPKNPLSPQADEEQVAAQLAHEWQLEADRFPKDIQYPQRSWKCQKNPLYTVDIKVNTIVSLTSTGALPADLAIEHLNADRRKVLSRTQLKSGATVEFAMMLNDGKRHLLQLVSAARIPVGQVYMLDFESNEPISVGLESAW